jgi:hypothetical protein
MMCAVTVWVCRRVFGDKVMKRIAVSVSLLVLGACSSEPDGSTAPASTGAASPAVRQAPQDESVAAVLQGTGQSPYTVRFLLDAAPKVGVPATVRVDVSAAEPVPALMLSASADALELDPAASQASLVLSEAGKAVGHPVRFTARQAGMTELLIQLKATTAEAQAVTYSIPILATEAAETPPAAAASPAS